MEFNKTKWISHYLINKIHSALLQLCVCILWWHKTTLKGKPLGSQTKMRVNTTHVYRRGENTSSYASVSGWMKKEKKKKNCVTNQMKSHINIKCITVSLVCWRPTLVRSDRPRVQIVLENYKPRSCIQPQYVFVVSMYVRIIYSRRVGTKSNIKKKPIHKMAVYHRCHHRRYSHRPSPVPKCQLPTAVIWTNWEFNNSKTCYLTEK